MKNSATGVFTGFPSAVVIHLTILVRVDAERLVQSVMFDKIPSQ